MASAVVWNGYEVFHPGVDRPLHEVTRPEANAAFGLLMDARAARVSMLSDLLAANGVAADDLRGLDDWFARSVEEDAQVPGRLAPVWYSVVNDMALLLGDTVIGNSGGSLRWDMVKSPKSDVSYQRAVIVGFAVANARYSVDYDLLLGMHGHRIVRGEQSDSGFIEKLVEDARSKSSPST